MTTDVITDETTTVQDAFEEAAAEKLAKEAEADVQDEDSAQEEAPDSGLSAQGGILPRLGEQTEFDGAGFEKPAKTSRQLAEEFLEHFQADVEKAETAVGNANRKLREARTLRDDAELNLSREIRKENEEGRAQADAEAATEEYAPTCTGHPCPVYADGEGDLAGQKVCHDGDDVSTVMVAEIGVTECPRYVGETGAEDSGIIPDQPVDPITGEVDGGDVLVSLPDDSEVQTHVGSRTRYGELIADWFTFSGYTGPMEDFQVRGEEDGRIRPRGEVIPASDYGAVLIVEAIA